MSQKQSLNKISNKQDFLFRRRFFKEFVRGGTYSWILGEISKGVPLESFWRIFGSFSQKKTHRGFMRKFLNKFPNKSWRNFWIHIQRYFWMISFCINLLWNFGTNSWNKFNQCDYTCLKNRYFCDIVSTPCDFLIRIMLKNSEWCKEIHFLSMNWKRNKSKGKFWEK